MLRSPTSRNLEPWEFIFVDDRQMLAKLAGCKPHGAAFLAGAPLGIIVCGDSTLSDVWVEDCSIASILLQMAAQSIGLGSCWIQVRNRQHDEQISSGQYVQALLGIPEFVKVESIIAIGYPAEKRDPCHANISKQRRSGSEHIAKKARLMTAERHHRALTHIQLMLIVLLVSCLPSLALGDQGGSGQNTRGPALHRRGREMAKLINDQMWDSDKQFYFDLTVEGKRAPAKTIAAFWTLLAQVASKSQAEALVAELRDPKTFGTVHRVPTLAADQTLFNPAGGYWRGAVWAPTDKMVVAGLEKFDYTDLAAEIALSHLSCVVDVFKETGTVWENYAPASVAAGKPARKDFVGWTESVRSNSSSNTRSDQSRCSGQQDHLAYSFT